MLNIHLITLGETPEREAQATLELAKYKLEVKVHRFKRQTPGWKGCIDSHLQIFQYGKDTNSEILWIAEDNLVSAFDKFPAKKYENLSRFMRKCSNWEIIFVGGYILRPWDYCQETIYPQLYETRNNNHGTISYIIHRRAYLKILSLHQLSPINIHYDIYLSKTCRKCYIYEPLLFYHANNVISNINRKSDFWRKWWFHPKMMKVHTLIFFHREWLYILLMLLVMIAGGMWCMWKSTPIPHTASSVKRSE
jgi:GR25 family glycosyltransferase involved in LPS biosynthesis